MLIWEAKERKESQKQTLHRLEAEQLAERLKSGWILNFKGTNEIGQKERAALPTSEPGHVAAAAAAAASVGEAWLPEINKQGEK